MSIAPDTTVGKVALTVRDLDRAQSFYERTVGLERLSGEAGRCVLGVGDRSLVELVGAPDATPRGPRTTGLYHLAILVPDRHELARSLQRLIAARWRLVGAADHLVSEAIYLQDPEGNGIEIYRDRPRSEWRYEGDELAMATLPLDLRSVMAELGERADRAPSVLPAGTRMGHVHLQVADLAEAERFYGELLGLDVTARGYPGALFMAAGGYHHHIGLNVWAGAGAAPPPPGSTGLRELELELPGRQAWEDVLARLNGDGIEIEGRGRRALVRDPSQNGVALVSPN